MNTYLERYLYNFGKKIPKDQRHQAKEWLWDQLRDQIGKEYPSQDDWINAMKKMGKPSDVAVRYLGYGKTVIGPPLYDMYIMFLVIGASVIGLGLFIAFFIRMIFSDYQLITVGRLLLEFVASFISGGLAYVGFLTLFFMLFEKIALNRYVPLPKSKFDPTKLPPAPKREETIKRSDKIAALIFVGLGIGVVEWLRFKGWIFTSEALNAYLPLWYISWGISVILNILLIVKGKWTLISRIIEWVGDGFGIFILVRMIQGPDLFLLQEWMMFDVFDINQVIRIGFGLAVFGVSIGMIYGLVRMIRMMLQKNH